MPAQLLTVGDIGVLVPSAAELATETARATAAEAFTKPETYGAIGDGIVNDTTAVNAAIAASRSVFLTTGKKYLVTSLTNTSGTEFYGAGKIVSAVTGGQKQLNSYSDADKYIFGREYLSYVHNKFINGTPSTTAVKAVMTGDSTTNGDSTTTPYRIWELLPSIALDLGFAGVTAVNRGQSGANAQNWIDSYLAGDLALTPDVLYIRWGANDPYYGRTVAQAIASIRSGLTTIRSSRTVANLSIILCTPNSMSDVPNARDAKYFEDFAIGLKQAARDFQCCFVDVYAYLRDSINAAAIWMDNPYADGRAIHPLNVMNTWISTLLCDPLFPIGLAAKVKTNANWNVSGAFVTKADTDLPQTYPYGSSQLRSFPLGSWPYDGIVITHRFADDYSIQINYPYAASVTNYAVRISTGSSWRNWIKHGDNPVNVTPNTGFALPGSEKMRTVLKGTTVTCDGYVYNTTPSTMAAGTIVAIVTANHRPIVDMWNVPIAVFDGTSIVFVNAYLTASTGTIAIQQAVAVVSQRVYLGACAWNTA